MKSTLSAAAYLIGLALISACKPQATEYRLGQIAQARVASEQFSGTVLVAREGKVLLDRGYGLADREWSIAATPATRFRVASITKQFTAAAILLLAERGKLALDAPLKTYLPDAPAAWDKVTVLNLLNHTSGIPDYLGAADYPATQAIPATPQLLLARFRDRPLDFAPGEGWAYSNSGYVLLGLLIEKQSGLSYGEFLRKNLFEPLGMRDSGYDDGAAVIARRASGYRLDHGAVVPALYRHQSTLYAAGGLYSTAEDLLRWQQALYSGKVLSAASLQRMLTPNSHQAGLGLMVLPLEDHVVYAHGGGVDGVHTMMSYDPATRVTVIVLSNQQDADVVALAGQLAAAARGETVVLPGERKDITVPAAKLQTYAGTYAFAPGFDIVFTLEGGQLFGQASGQQKYPATAEAPGMFYFRVNGAEVEFFGDAKGHSESLVLQQNGQYFKALRKE